MKSTAKKMLFLYLKTGGGHLAPARSISEYYRSTGNNEVETILYDGFDKSNKIVRFVIVDGYRILQNKAKWIYELIYAIHKIKMISITSAWIINQFVEGRLGKKIDLEKPDKIVIFHFFLIKPVYEILHKKNLNIPVITVVTDPFTAHPLWFLNKKQNFILFSDILKNKFVDIGIDETNIKVLSFPLHEKHSVKPSDENLQNYKRNLGLTSEKVLLVLGGGDGIPKGISILKSLCKNRVNYDIVFVCGNNKSLYKKVLKMKEKDNLNFLKVFGFTDMVYELISVSDAVITKCGASTIMEILIAGKFPIVNNYIWEQEKGNVEFLIKNNLGVYEKRISKLPVTIEKIFSGEIYFEDESKIILNNGTSELANHLLG